MELLSALLNWLLLRGQRLYLRCSPARGGTLFTSGCFARCEDEDIAAHHEMTMISRVGYAFIGLTLIACGGLFTVAGGMMTMDGPGNLDTRAAAVVEEDTSPVGANVKKTSVPWGGLEHRKAGVGLKRARLIVVLLHGYGSTADDLVGLAGMIDSGVSTGYIFPAAPIELGSGRRGWNLPDGEGFDASRGQVLELLMYLHETYPQADVVVGGFSQGATLAISLLAEHLTQVKGYLFFSPGWYLSHQPRGGDDLPGVFLSHGEKDSILPFTGSEALRAHLGEAGYVVTWFPFAGGHTIPAAAITATNAFLAGIMP